MHDSIRLTDTNSESESTERPVALITGGTDGIGRAVASQVAQAGIRVLLVGRNRTEDLRRRASCVQNSWGREILS